KRRLINVSLTSQGLITLFLTLRLMRYYLDRQGRFVIEGYERAKPFASFFPGIAGPWGIPMWVFYVNRGQGVVSLGTKDKNSAIAEFLPADRAWELASVQGFRTFLKIRREKGKGTLYYEPFQDGPENRRFKVRRRMKISSYELEIEEINRDLGIKSEVRYWTLPNEPVAALAREAAWTNLGSQGIDIEVVDGLPKVVPYGTGDFFLKKMSRTIQAWMQTQILPPGGSGCRAGQGKGRIAFYNLSVDPRDRPETLFIDGGNFYFAFLRRDGSSRRRGGEGRTQLLDLIVDPQFLFGGGDLSYPRSFVSAAKFRARMEAQGRESRMPCAMSYAGFYLRPGQGQVVSSLLGYSRNKEWLLPCVDKILNDGFLARKREENQGIIRAIEDNLDTRSALREFNLYARQTFLDNVLRGGYPLSLDTAAGKKAFYVYSRKHGDLERGGRYASDK
ncbi:MAG: hypothetical protein ACE5GG_06250, partial [Candidatus Omnitrophota bacterium]